MNFRLISWLIQHRDVLSKIAAAVQDFDPESSYTAKWDVVDRVARIVIPLIDEQLVASAMYEDEPEPVEAFFALGAQAAASGIDWKQLVDVIIPILLAILKALGYDE